MSYIISKVINVIVTKQECLCFILIEVGAPGLRMSPAPSCQLSSLLPGKIIRECQKTGGVVATITDDNLY